MSVIKGMLDAVLYPGNLTVCTCYLKKRVIYKRIKMKHQMNLPSKLYQEQNQILNVLL